MDNRKIMMIFFLTMISICLAGCSQWNHEAGNNTAVLGDDGKSGSDGVEGDGGMDAYAGQADGDEQDYSLKIVEMSRSEQEDALGKLFSFMESCEDVHGMMSGSGGAGQEISGDISAGTDCMGGADEDALHEMIEIGAKQGLSVTCGNRDYNLTNYGQVDAALTDALAGKDSTTEFYQVNAASIFRYYHLAFVDGELFVTSAAAMFGEDMEFVVQQLEKIQAYQWEYTKKGWLIWEKALSRNQEMDMHIFCRVLPLEEQCREIARQYIIPVSYFCNNLFLTDWDGLSMEKIEFNDLFDFLYAEETGKRPDEGEYGDGIPKEEFETVIGRYFDISVEEMQRYGRYDSVKGRYPWSAIGIRNRVQQLQPSFAEVVRCVENGDGTVTAYVEAVSVEEGLDCYYAHEVTLRRKEDGRYVYAGNRVDREHSFCVPAYRARREFERAGTE